MDKGSGLLLGNLGQAGQSRPLKISASVAQWNSSMAFTENGWTNHMYTGLYLACSV